CVLRIGRTSCRGEKAQMRPQASGVAGGCGDVDAQKPVGASVLAPLCKRCGRCAKRTTNSLSRCGPLRLRSRGLRATFLLRFQSDMLLIRVRGLRCHPDQAMKGSKTTTQHLQHDHTFYGFFTVSLPYLYDFPAALCHPERVPLQGVALVAPHL